MFSENHKVVVVIDIGGSKVVSIIAKTSSNGSVDILGVGNIASEGIKNGAIYDIKTLRTVIASSVYEAEQRAARNIDTVIVNISSPLMKTSLIKVVNKFGGKQVLSNDLKKTVNAALSKIDLSKYEILYHSVLGYDLDEMVGLKDPEFMFANKLVSYINVITVPVKYLINLSGCLLGCQLKISDFVVSSYASALVCADDFERAKGCIVVDIGGDTLDYVVIKDNKIMDSGVVPLGGKIITRDIANYFSMDFVEAEKIKILHGNLCYFTSDEEKTIEVVSISNQEEPKKINNELLNKVIKSRFKEIVDIFIKKIKEKALDKECKDNIIFTGGSSQFVGLEEFLNEQFKLKAKKGLPVNVKLSSELELSADFSTSCGLIKYSMCKHDNNLRERKYSVKKAFSWLKQNF
jgi:cell division protein FtsA